MYVIDVCKCCRLNFGCKSYAFFAFMSTQITKNLLHTANRVLNKHSPDAEIRWGLQLFASSAPVNHVKLLRFILPSSCRMIRYQLRRLSVCWTPADVGLKSSSHCATCTWARPTYVWANGLDSLTVPTLRKTWVHASTRRPNRRVSAGQSAAHLVRMMTSWGYGNNAGAGCYAGILTDKGNGIMHKRCKRESALDYVV